MATFIAIDEKINGEKVKGVFNVNIFKMIACNEKKCTVATKNDMFTITKEDHPKSYKNFYDFSQSSSVFRSTVNN